MVAALRPAASVWLFGHVADGNIHVNVTGVDADDEAVDDAVLRHVAVVRRVDLGRARHRHGQEALAPPQPQRRPSCTLFAQLKAAFDPTGILNPNVLLP